MAKQQSRPMGEIIGFHIGGALPLERVGFILKELYESGAHDLNIQPITNPVPEATPITKIAKKARKRLLALPPPTRRNKTKGRMPSSAAIKALLVEAHPKLLPLSEIFDMVEIKVGVLSRQAVSVCLSTMKGAGLVRHEREEGKESIYGLTAKGYSQLSAGQTAT